MRLGRRAGYFIRRLGFKTKTLLSILIKVMHTMPKLPLTPAALRLRFLLVALQQVVIVLIACFVLAFIFWMIRVALARNGIAFDLNFLTQPAGFNISEGLTLTWDGLKSVESDHSNLQTLLAGLGNTLKAAVLAIIASTLVGILLGIARLSHNWLVRQLSFVLIECVRNTPLLIQLVFWYFVVVLKLPALHDAAQGFAVILASQQGIFLPGIALNNEASWISLSALGLSLLLTVATWFFANWRKVLLIASVVTWLMVWLMGFPLTTYMPEVDGFVITAGMSISPEFAAILLGLSLYSAAFIAEIVRGAMLSLAKGQWEACAALGMSRSQTLRDVIVPQVWRIILPALGNQYISLTKNTSLGIAIGYPDLFNVYGTVANQSGRALEGVLVAMFAYLLLSWLISALVNGLNRREQRLGKN